MKTPKLKFTFDSFDFEIAWDFYNNPKYAVLIFGKKEH